MSKIDTVYIHHDVLGQEAQVPAESVPVHISSGWLPGRLEGAAEAEAEAAAAQAQTDAAAIAAAIAGSPKPAEDLTAPPVAETSINVAADTAAAQNDERRNRGAAVNVPAGTNPTTPEEGPK